MQRLLTGLVVTALSTTAFAEINLEPLLNKVSLRLHAETWVTTKTALVNVLINASVTDQGIEKIQSSVMQKLNQLIANVDWHIVSFDRTQDQSGLESIQITAQARVAQSDLGNLRDKAKNMTKPGETYKIDSVQFVPSEDELQQANIVLRNNIYQQAKAEIDTLNKSYPDQKYYIHQIDFNSMPGMPMPMAKSMYMRAETMSAGAPLTTNGAPLSVGNKQELFANVMLASFPDQILQIANKTQAVKVP